MGTRSPPAPSRTGVQYPEPSGSRDLWSARRLRGTAALKGAPGRPCYSTPGARPPATGHPRADAAEDPAATSRCPRPASSSSACPARGSSRPRSRRRTRAGSATWWPVRARVQAIRSTTTAPACTVPRDYLAQDRGAEAASQYSFKDPPAREAIAGTHDAAPRCFSTGTTATHRVYWTYWHKPDDELYVTHSSTPARYRAARAHLRTIFARSTPRAQAQRLRDARRLAARSLTPNVAPQRP